MKPLGSGASSAANRRGFLRSAGALAATIALVSGSELLSPITALASTRKEKTNMQNSLSSTASAKINIVLVHGAWADASSWSRVIPLLHNAGHFVAAVQLPLTGHLADDVNATREVLNHSQLQGPTILVGHSYGGAVITNAAVGQTNVAGLVYVAAYAPAEGEKFSDFPVGEGLASTYLDSNTPPQFSWIKQEDFRAAFAQDVDPLQASLMATVQKPVSLSILQDPSSTPAWQTLPSWYIVSTQDHMLPPETQQMFASRMKATTVSVPASHASMVSYPTDVFNLIQQAAIKASQRIS